MLNPPALLRANNGAGPDLSIVDLPVLCATTKLWFLELEQPPFTWAAYDELRSGWSARVGITEGGGETAGADDAEEKVTLLAKVVGKLPRIHFEVSASRVRCRLRTDAGEVLSLYSLRR